MARAKKLTKKDVELLAHIVEATMSEAGMMFVSEKETSRLVENGLVEINVTMSTEDGKVAARATEDGVASIGGQRAAVDAQVESRPKTVFELETGVEVPIVRRGGRGATIYPFDAMDVGHSFHVPATEQRPNPAKALASTVSSATGRYKNDDGEVTRKFVIRNVGDDDPKGKGARIFRVQ